MWFEGKVMDGEVKIGLQKSQYNEYKCGFHPYKLLLFHLNLARENHSMSMLYSQTQWQAPKSIQEDLKHETTLWLILKDYLTSQK